jgi:hypothetical protein
VKQPSRKTVFVVVALSLLGLAGTAAAASIVAPPTHTSDHGPAGALFAHFGFKTSLGTAPTPIDTPHHHGGCGWHHSGDGW